MTSRVIVKVDLDWSGPGHYDPEHNLACGECGQPTKMRDNRGLPCHHSCAEQAMAREIFGRSQPLLDERFGYSEQDLTDELLGRPAQDAAGERVPTPAARLTAARGGAR
jgi:hypothetical protein